MLAEAPNYGFETGAQIPEGVEPLSLPDFLNIRQISRVSSSLDQIQAFLQERSGGRLPQSLIDQLGFEKLEWQLLYDPRMVEVLFLGASDRWDEPIHLSDTLGTVSLKGGIDNPRRVYHSDIGVAGVGRVSDGSARVLSVGYSRHHRLANHVDVSVTHQEFPKPTDNNYALLQYNNTTRPIPSTPDSVYWTGGVITTAMVAAAANEEGNVPRRAFFAYDTQGVGKSVRPHDGNTSFRLGFVVQSYHDIHRVAYTGPSAAFSIPSGFEISPNVSHWHVDFPKKLQ